MLAAVVSSCEKGFLNGRAVTGDATDISCRYATLSGSTSSPDKGISYIEYSTNSKFEDTEDDFVETLLPDNIGSDGIIKMKTKLLKPETTYYYRCVHTPAVNKGPILGDVRMFKTLSVSTMIKTEGVTDISFDGATLNGSINLDNCYDYEGEFRGVSFLFGYPSWEFSREYVPLTENKFSYRMTSLEPNGKYGVIAYVDFSGGRYYGERIVFSTADFPASVITGDASDVIYTSVTLNAVLDVSGLEQPTKEVWFYLCEKATMAGRWRVSSVLSGDTFSVNTSGLKEETTYYYQAYAKVNGRDVEGDIKSFTTKPLPDSVVDMGLSVKWALYNIGASKPEEYGDYYAWGETEPKSSYEWGNYKYGDSNSLNKYCTDYKHSNGYSWDNKTVLEPNDDVAYVKLGGRFRMPTRDEWNELLSSDNCIWIDSTLNGVNGVFFTSKKTGNSIFLPKGGD